MKNKIIDLIQQGLNKLLDDGVINDISKINIQVNPTRQSSHGDFATNISLMLAKQAKSNPKELAQKIIGSLPQSNIITKMEIAGPGFINFFLNQDAQFNIIETILKDKQKFGSSNLGKAQSVNVEFVSANPTGPLHVGHGRGAAIGSAISSILKFTGYKVTQEYYVNDAGRQMDILATSIWLRYLELNDPKLVFPTNGYKGDYIIDIAKNLYKQYQDRFCYPLKLVFSDLPDDYNPNTKTGDKEKYIDALIDKAKLLLKDDYKIIHQYGLTTILNGIKDDLAAFNVHYDSWFSEKSLTEDVEYVIDYLGKHNWLYQKDGATWFKSKELGDEKDRVLVRENGQTTYFASDASYMGNKFINRGFDKLIYLFGADHHGYINRLICLGKALGYDTEALKIPLIQFAVLYRGGKQVQMSSRSGTFVTLRELINEVGTDATRFFYIMRKADQHLDFDLDLAKSKSNENPVYYIQYAYARICSVFRQLKEQDKSFDKEIGLENLNLLDTKEEISLANKLAIFPDIIEKSAMRLEPHLITTYMRELANQFHSYYNTTKFIVENNELTQARLALIEAIQQVFANALLLLGLNAPERM